MRRRNLRGVAIIEFSFATLVLVPLLLGTIGIGLNLTEHLQTVQLARDAGYMYARQVDFTETATKTLLVGLGAELGLSTNATTSKAVLMLSTVEYVDKDVCKSANKWNNTTDMPNGCTNYQKWVFTQRIVVGNPNVRASSFGTPTASLVDSSGNISLANQATNTGVRAVSASTGGVERFAGISPYSSVDGAVSGLPSGQLVYVAEAAGKGFSMPPFVTNPVMYSFNLF